MTPLVATWPHDLWALRLSETAASSVDGFHRSWIMLFREGKFPHQEYGEVDLSRRTLDEIKANFDGGARGIEIALDEEHDAKKATGWIEQLEYRPGVAGQPAGLWAYVRWTPYGLQMLKEQVYRYISPEFRREWKNPISGQTFKNVLVGGALTNRPFLQMDAIQLSTRRRDGGDGGGDEGSRRMATTKSRAGAKAGMKRGRPADDEAEDEALAEGEALDDEEEYAEGETPEDEMYDEADGDGPDAEPDEDEEEAPPAPKKRARKRAAASSKKMSERYGEGRHDGETLALREQLRLQERQLSELREREQALSLKLYERAVDEQIAAWGGEQVAPSKALGDAYRGFMLSEGLRLSEAAREAVRALVELAFTSAVDLSQNAASFDMETRVTRASDGDKVVETANRLALSDARNTAKKDMMSLASGTSEERALAREMLSRALKETGAEIGKLQLVSK